MKRYRWEASGSALQIEVLDRAMFGGTSHMKTTECSLTILREDSDAVGKSDLPMQFTYVEWD